MPKETNYFEEAYRLCQDADSLVSHTAKALYDQMLCQILNNKLLPLGKFNILYFFQSTIRALLMEFPKVTLTSSIFPCPFEPINGWNWPDGLQMQTCDAHENCSLLLDYMEIVKEDSDPAGDEFDVSYASTIIIKAIDQNEQSNILNAWKDPASIALNEGDTLDFDYWLSGFNCDQA